MTKVNEVSVEQLGLALHQVQNPVVVRGLTTDWPIVQAAKQGLGVLSDYLLEQGNPILVGTGKVPQQYQGRLFYNDDYTDMNFERTGQDFYSFVDLLFNEQKDARYMGSTNVNQLFKHFKQDNALPLIEPFSPLVSAWLSNQTSVAPHQDFPDNLAVCVAGKRRFTLFPPDQVENLYIGPLEHTPAGQPISLVNVQDPDFNQHPKYELALQQALVVELEPGDALLIPSLWWHAVEGLESVNMLINYWWQTSANYLGSPMDALMHSIMNISALAPEQKQAMKALFDHYVFNDTVPNEHIPEQARGVLSQDEMAVRKIRAYLINKLNQ